jgi:hypothetical protein
VWRVLVLVAVLAGMLAVAPAASAAVTEVGKWELWAPCVDVLFIGARGSGQTGGTMGPQLDRAFRGLVDGLRDEDTSGQNVVVAYFPLPYTAVDVGLFESVMAIGSQETPAYRISRNGGADLLRDYVDFIEGLCPDRTFFVLGGFSQGADVTTLAASARMSLDRVTAMVLLGNPKLDPDDNSVKIGQDDSEQSGGRIGQRPVPGRLEWGGTAVNACAAGDPVCDSDVSIPGAIFASTHSYYFANGLSDTSGRLTARATWPFVRAGAAAGTGFTSCSPPVPPGNQGVADTTQYDPEPCSGVNLRAEPVKTLPPIGTLAQGTVFPISCQVQSDTVTDSRGYSSNIWNRTSYGGLTGWVADTWSGHKGWLGIPCDQPAPNPNGCHPPVPSGNQGVADTTEWDAEPCSGVYLRSGPYNWATIAREISQGTVFPIVCQERGDTITDSRGYSSNIWNRTSYGGLTGWVADTWSGHKGWLNLQCPAPTQCSPPVPSGPQGVADTTQWAPFPCSGVFVRDRAANKDAVVLGEWAQGTVFTINCQQHGQLITDSAGYQSDIWNNATFGGLTGWVADTWSGHKGWLGMDCSASPPSAPGITATVPGSGSIEVRFSEPAGNGGVIIDYQIEIRDLTGSSSRTVTSASTSKTITGLVNDHSHQVRVRARNYKGWGVWSAWSPTVVPFGLPWQPGTPIAVHAAGGVDVFWSWTTEAGNGAPASGFEVQYDRSGALASQTVGATLRTAYLAISPIAEVRVRLRALNAAGWGDWSDWSVSVVVPDFPGSPSLPSATLGDGEVTVQWSAPGSDGGATILGYQVTASPGESACSTSGTSCTVEGLVNGTSYQFGVKAYNLAGWSPAATVTATPYGGSSEMSFRSVGAFDGWVLEREEESEKGSRTLDSTATTARLGDDALDRQYRSILSFDTSTLPDDAVITAVTLRIKRQGVTGTNPFTTHGVLIVDQKSGFYHEIQALERFDFHAAGSRGNVGRFVKTPDVGWYRAPLRGASYSLINVTGSTQFRLRFELDDNDDLSADYLSFYTGNAAEADRPELIVTYYVP